MINGLMSSEIMNDTGLKRGVGMTENDIVSKDYIYTEYKRKKERVNKLGIALTLWLLTSVFVRFQAEFVIVCLYAIGMLVSFTVLMVLLISTWKCPMCYESLGSTWNPHYCPHCGTQLQE
jgi:hypothetical protein